VLRRTCPPLAAVVTTALKSGSCEMDALRVCVSRSELYVTYYSLQGTSSHMKRQATATKLKTQVPSVALALPEAG
jgi:hypothetical protein